LCVPSKSTISVEPTGSISVAVVPPAGMLKIPSAPVAAHDD